MAPVWTKACGHGSLCGSATFGWMLKGSASVCKSAWFPWAGWTRPSSRGIATAFPQCLPLLVVCPTAYTPAWQHGSRVLIPAAMPLRSCTLPTPLTQSQKRTTHLHTHKHTRTRTHPCSYASTHVAARVCEGARRRLMSQAVRRLAPPHHRLVAVARYPLHQHFTAHACKHTHAHTHALEHRAVCESRVTHCTSISLHVRAITHAHTRTCITTQGCV